LAGGKSLAVGVIFMNGHLDRFGVTALILIEYALANRTLGNKPFFSHVLFLLYLGVKVTQSA
jgi:hypothetical protein